MPLDSLVLDALAQELAGRLVGSRIEKVVQPDDKTLGLKVFPPADAWLLLCIDPRAGYVALTTSRPEATPYPPTFTQLARSRIEGAHITGLRAPPIDRVVTLACTGGPPDARVRMRLVLELFGPAGDLYLVDDADARILGHLRRGPLPPRLTQGIYVSATAPAREDLMVLEASARRDRIEHLLYTEGPGALFRTLAGVGPSLAAVAAAALALPRPDGFDGATSIARVARGIAAYLEAVAAHHLTPGVVQRERPEVILACPPDLVDGLQVTPQETVNDAVLDGLVERLVRHTLDDRRRALERTLDGARAREEARLAAAQEGLAKAREWPRLERWGNLLKGQLAQIKPFASIARVVDYYDSESSPPLVDVPIKPTLAPRQNVDRYFTRAKKLKLSLTSIERRVAEHTRTIDLLGRLRAMVADAGDRDAIEALEARARALTRAVAGHASEPHSRSDRKAVAGTPGPKARLVAGVLSFVSSEGRSILVGRSAHENDMLTKRIAKAHDVWLHAQDAAGAHVVVRMHSAKDQCPSRTLEEAAQLAAHYSKSRYDTRVTVLVARAGDVRKVPGAPPGQVTVRRHSTMIVRPDAGIVTRLMEPV